jgi:hypothetical protein
MIPEKGAPVIASVPASVGSEGWRHTKVGHE